MYPAAGLPLDKLQFPVEAQEQIQEQLGKLRAGLGVLGIGGLYSDYTPLLPNLSLKTLRQLLRLRPLLIDFGLIHPKVEKSQEFLGLQQLIEEQIPAALNRAESLVTKLDTDLKKSYPEVVSQFNRRTSKVVQSEEYFNFSQFRPLIEQVTGDERLLKEVLAYEDDYENVVEELLAAMKQQIMAAKANLPKLVEQLGTDIIQVEAIKDLDEVAYEYLRLKAFGEFAASFFKISVPLDKGLFQQHVLPDGSSLAGMLKLAPDEMGIFSLSVDPIKDLGLQVGQTLGTGARPNLTYEVVSSQKQMKQSVTVNHQVDQDSWIQVVVPVYFSYLKARLIAEQRSTSIKRS